MSTTPPYYAVIFTSTRTDIDEGYSVMAQRMEDLAREQPGFIDVESARSELGITVSYWESTEAIAQWKQQVDHLLAQELGKAKWYEWYKVRICKVEHSYDFSK